MNKKLILCALALSASPLAAQTPDTLRMTLGSAARLGAQQNAQVVEARYRVEEARARVLNQRSALLPQISGQVVQSSHTLNTASFGIEFPTPPGQQPFFDPNGEIIGPVKLSDVRGRLSQTVFDLSALRRVKGAQVAVETATAQMEGVEQRSGAAAANAYVQALRAQQLYGSRQADVALAEDLVRIARQQLESGTGVRLDVTRAEAQLAAVSAQMIAARNGVQRAQLQLARALGVSPTTVVVLADSIPNRIAQQPTNVDEALRIAHAKRADIKALDAQIKASELQVSAIKAERLPSVSFVGDNGYIGKSWDHLLHTYDWALQVSVPVFQGFRGRAREEEARAQIGQLQARRHDVEDQFNYEVRAAVLDLNGASEQVDAATARLRLAQQELSDARTRYESGVAGSGDVVTASLRLNDARTAYADALVAYHTARVALAAAEGTVTELE